MSESLDFEATLQRLQRDLRRLRMTVLSLLLAFGGVVLVGSRQASKPTRIEASEIVLTAKDGSIMTLDGQMIVCSRPGPLPALVVNATAPGGPLIELHDAKGQIRTMWTVAPEGVMLTMSGERGETASLGTVKYPGLTLESAGGNVLLSSHPQIGPSLNLFTTEDIGRLRLSASRSVSYMQVFDAAGKERATLNSSGTLTLMANDGSLRQFDARK